MRNIIHILVPCHTRTVTVVKSLENKKSFSLTLTFFPELAKTGTTSSQDLYYAVHIHIIPGLTTVQRANIKNYYSNNFDIILVHAEHALAKKKCEMQDVRRYK